MSFTYIFTIQIKTHTPIGVGRPDFYVSCQALKRLIRPRALNVRLSLQLPFLTQESWGTCRQAPALPMGYPYSPAPCEWPHQAQCIPECQRLPHWSVAAWALCMVQHACRTIGCTEDESSAGSTAQSAERCRPQVRLW